MKRKFDHHTAYSIKFEDASFAYEHDGRTILKELNHEIGQGLLVGVIGKVEAGKSSLIKAIAGEMINVSGRLKVNVSWMK